MNRLCNKNSFCFIRWIPLIAFATFAAGAAEIKPGSPADGAPTLQYSPAYRPADPHLLALFDLLRMEPRAGELINGGFKANLTDIFAPSGEPQAKADKLFSEYQSALLSKAAQWDRELKSLRAEFESKMIQELPPARREAAAKALELSRAAWDSATEREAKIRDGFVERMKNYRWVAPKTGTAQTSADVSDPNVWLQDERRISMAQEEMTIKALVELLTPEESARIDRYTMKRNPSSNRADTPHQAAPASPAVALDTASSTPATSTVQAVTSLTINPRALNLGELFVGESRSAGISLENKTDKTITVKNLRGSCGCLSVHMDSPELAAGKTGMISIKYTGVGARKLDTVAVQFSTDEQNTPSVRIPIEATVKQAFILTADVLQFKQIKKGESKTLETVIRSADGKAFEIKQVATNNTEFTCKWAPLQSSNGAAYTISVTVLSKKGGMLSDIARISTDRVVTDGLQVYLNAAVETDAVCEPGVLISSAGDGGIVAPFEATVKRITPGKLEILNVTETRQYKMSYKTTPIDEISAKLTITLDEPVSKLMPLGQFIIQTNAEEAPLRIPYRVQFPAKKP